MKKIRYFFVVAFILSIVSYCGCGYTTRAYIGAYKSIYVAPFKNRVNIADSRSEYSRSVSYYPLLESTITQAVVNRFILTVASMQGRERGCRTRENLSHMREDRALCGKRRRYAVPHSFSSQY
jgi:hypothetical protein